MSTTPHNERQEMPTPALSERRLMGSLRDALVAAAAPSKPPQVSPPPLPSVIAAPAGGKSGAAHAGSADVSAPISITADAEAAARLVEAANLARGGSKRLPPPPSDPDAPITRVVRPAAKPTQGAGGRTQLLRGRTSIKQTEFFQDPVVGWLVIVGGAGLGAFRPIYEGNNTIGRNANQRIAINFGDEAISGEEQAYLRYDSVDRKFLLVPNLSKTNIVAVNDRKPTAAVELAAMDLITMGRTQLVFVPFCSPEFDWAELSEMKG